MATKEQLIACRKTYSQSGFKRIEVIRHDGKVSTVTDRAAIDTAMCALVSEADRQLSQGVARDTKEQPQKCRGPNLDGGCQLIELTHPDGCVSGIRNHAAIRVVLDALKGKLDCQIASA